MNENTKLGIFVLVTSFLGSYASILMGISHDYLKSIPFSIVFMFTSFIIYYRLNKKLKSR
ncbi:hypothetical protein SAMN05421780_105140 [Flexibacter flexilis DSM 6793]|uniref:Uncharacterized protein n=1 Tax=Flexibacter flexilis DSM 6793 TaxID=927664 RepID=A0A1I1IYP4_9BACT|nr:hypothetical protein SAMN05421780_105140 [Flexibacter flexilis DSM 6793]